MATKTKNIFKGNKNGWFSKIDYKKDIGSLLSYIILCKKQIGTNNILVGTVNQNIYQNHIGNIL